MGYFVAIAGNMGVGKSTLTKRLSQFLHWEPYFEPVGENPYLADFYHDMHRFAFQSQIFFLSHRLKQHSSISHSPQSILQDRSVYEDAEVFARNLYEGGFMSDRDWHTYQNIYNTLIELLPKPDLIIYLHASVDAVMERIEKRGRDFEQGVDRVYLEHLQKLYDRFAVNFSLAPIMAVDTTYIDFSQDMESVEKLARDILVEITSPVRTLRAAR